MRIALVGPTHPHKGGISAHTTELAHRLVAVGHDVDLVSWSAQYPRLLYPGEPHVPGGQPERLPFPSTVHPLAWYSPAGWWGTGRRLRDRDAILVVVATPIQCPAYRVLLAGAGETRAVVIAHNVLPHEQRPGDRRLMRSLLRRSDAVLVHTSGQRELAEALGAHHVEVAALPPHFPQPSGPAEAAQSREGRPIRLLFFGIVRPYKGLDVLLRALARAPDTELVVAGEFWGTVGATGSLVSELGLGDRVELRPGYVPASEVSELFAAADVLVMPYRSASATQNNRLAAAHGLPVVATCVGSLAEEVRDGVDGLLVPPDDPVSLAAAIRSLHEPGALARLRAGVVPFNGDAQWDAYIVACERLAALPNA